MLTVPQAARRVGRNPETVRRWIRQGKLRATKVGTQHIIDEAELIAVTRGDQMLPAPAAWDRTITGEPMPNVVLAIRRSRDGH
jgi:excisionase family DNA binding protein